MPEFSDIVGKNIINMAIPFTIITFAIIFLNKEKRENIIKIFTNPIFFIGLLGTIIWIAVTFSLPDCIKESKKINKTRLQTDNFFVPASCIQQIS